jgi:hypothetical protein
LTGCCHEAERAEIVWFRLGGLKEALAQDGHPHLDMTIEELHNTTRILRELADLSQIHQDRVPIVLDHLNIVLPSLSRSLRDITSHYEDTKISKQNRWRKMYHTLSKEAGGLALPQRFQLYNHFFSCLRGLLTRSTLFDLNQLEKIRIQIIKIREAQSIPLPPLQVGPLVRFEALSAPEISPTVHWAEQIFSLPLSSRTPFKGPYVSKSFGPHRPWGHLRTPTDSKILFRRPFNDDKISLIVYLDGKDRCPYFLLRTFHMGGPWYSKHGVHELCIEREGSSLRLKRWSKSEGCSKLWAVLYFMTWEELVLMHCTFLALKAFSPLTLQLGNNEQHLRSERKLFQARIIDDGFMHSLIVHEDRLTGGFRLLAAVWDGPLRQCPVWTAFVTHQCASATWIRRVSKHKVRLSDIQLYVFFPKYQQLNQRRGSTAAFEIQFVSEEASQRFRDVFNPPTDDESPGSL